jgi:hypothetical protein
MAKNKLTAEENIMEVDKDGKGQFSVKQWGDFCDLYNIKMELRKNEYLAMFLAVTGDKYGPKTRSKTLHMTIEELKKFVVSMWFIFAHPPTTLASKDTCRSLLRG